MSREIQSDANASDAIKQASNESMDTIKNESAKLADTAKTRAETIARDKAEEAREKVAAHTDSVESALHDVAGTLGEHSDTLGHYAGEFADSLTTLNDRIKDRSLDELASDARNLARDNPALFMLGAVAIGAVAARFFQASSNPTTGGTATSHYRDNTKPAPGTVGHVPGSVNYSTGGQAS